MAIKEIYGEVTVQILRLESATRLMPEVEYNQYEKIVREIEARLIEYQAPDGWEIDIER